MVQSPYWAANWFAASQEIPRISRNPKVHYRTHKRPPPVSILSPNSLNKIIPQKLLEPYLANHDLHTPPQYTIKFTSKQKHHFDGAVLVCDVHG